MKSLLVRIGRDGGWSSFLRSGGVPRATADRYVQQHENRLHPQQANCLGEAIKSPEDRARYLAQKLLPRLNRELLTSGEVAYFMDELAKILPAAHSGSITDGIDVQAAEGTPSPEPLGPQLAIVCEL